MPKLTAEEERFFQRMREQQRQLQEDIKRMTDDERDGCVDGDDDACERALIMEFVGAGLRKNDEFIDELVPLIEERARPNRHARRKKRGWY